MQQSIDQLRSYLKSKNFYTHLEQTPKLISDFSKEYNDTSTLENKRNIFIPKKWDTVKSFGEPRKILILELGGSYLKLFDVEVLHDEKITIHKHQSVQFYQDKLYTPEIIFSDMKTQLDAFFPESERSKIAHCVFIFTFPIEQFTREDGYVDAVCTYFGKGHRSEGMIGTVMGESLQSYLQKNGYPAMKVCVTNDTPASLLALKSHEIHTSEYFHSAINIIVGTGFNIATTINTTNNNQSGFIIVNTECGNFKSVILSKFDEIFNEQVDSKNEYLTEKMVSGVWQPHIFKIIVTEMIRDQILPPESIINFNFDNMDAGEIEKFLENPPKNLEHVDSFRFIWGEIISRAATICAILLVSFINENLKKEQVTNNITIGIVEVGSVIEKAKGFKKTLLDTIDNLLGQLQLTEKVQYKFINQKHTVSNGCAIFDTLLQSNEQK